MGYTEITSRKNHHIKHVKKLLRSSAFRERERAFLVEGRRLSNELIKQENIEILKCFLSKDIYSSLQEPLLSVYNKSKERFICEDFVIKNISDTKNTQGIICVCRSKRVKFNEKNIEKGKKYIVLENISDPGNLGTIIRTAEGLGIDGLILSGSGVDLYNPKVIRASMGSFFRLPIFQQEDTKNVMEIFKRKSIKTYGAVLSEKAKLLSETNFSHSAAIFIGNEANGLEEWTYSNCDENIIIDMKSNTESLNAAIAAGIIMWEMLKKDS